MSLSTRIAFYWLILLLGAASPSPVWAANNWETHGPEGGDVRVLAIDPLTPTTLYAGVSGGIYKSTDGGASWQRSSSGLPVAPGAYYVNALAIDPSSPATLYAGTSNGVFKTTDGGASWLSINDGLSNTSVTDIIIDATVRTTLYAGTNNGVFKTTDGGASWHPASTDLSNRSVTVLAIDPSTPTTLYAGTQYGTGVFKSTDGGASWSPINSGLTSSDVTAIVIDPTSPATLYVATFGDGVFKSTDGGGGWVAADGGLTQSFVNALAFNPTDPATLYAGVQGGVFKTTDGGANWKSSSNGMIGGCRVATLAVHPATTTTVYAGASWPGVFKSTDSGTSWQAVNTGLIGANVYALATDPTAPDTVYAGTMGAGISKSTNGGRSWQTVNNGLAFPDIFALAIDPTTPNTIYAGGFGVFKTTDGGASWQSIGGNGINGPVTAIAIDPATPTTLYAIVSDLRFPVRLYKSTDGGASWQLSSSGLPNAGCLSLTVDIPTGLAIHPATPTTLYVGTCSGVYKSTDAGASWQPSSSGLPFVYGSYPIVNAIAIDPKVPTTLYASAQNLVDEPGGIFKSTDGGESWLGTGVSSVFVRTLIIDPIATNVLYAGTSAGVFKSSTAWPSWRAMNDGLGNLDVRAVALNPATPTIVYAGTGGGGVYVRQLDPPTVTSITPNTGPDTGGQTVTIWGTEFVAGNTSVTFGGVPAASVNVFSAQQLSAVAPPHIPGAVEVMVTSRDGSASAAAGYTYYPATLPLLVAKAGTGNGTVTSNPSGIECGSDCTDAFAYNSQVTLTAAAEPGSIFLGWSGEGCSGRGACYVWMTQARNVTATFSRDEPAIDLWVMWLGTSFGNVNTHRLHATVVPNPNGALIVADVYLAVQLPDGKLLFAQPNGGFTASPAPFVRNWTVGPFSGPVFEYIFNGWEPRGMYRWFAAFTRPGTLSIIGQIAQYSFAYPLF